MPAHQLDPVVTVTHQRDVRVYCQLAFALGHVAAQVQDLESAVRENSRALPDSAGLVILGHLDALERPERPELTRAHTVLHAHMSQAVDQIVPAPDPPHNPSR